MSKENIVLSWKDPLSRKNNLQNPAGNPFTELEEAQMDKLAGAGDMEAACTWTLPGGGGVCTVTSECIC
ncbi:plantaricin C family lantibiotic [Bacillus swezeyi]|uniref:Plantaricin C family lantibiotic n=1 Tax=Bacillus swezeyi TaxID=1925020 RepID=A0A1R1S1Q6_9BACI|nr:plantaricin C family lantibiotic [Bacillus swezeyi]MEC1259049.1 plantaricin C family lantibiotic [Bacillus swezeyi]MED2927990.1 plantaricin C family lantibiotic [Bacillus swezeyi]MED2965098.1 plantaricin C family lantibiotic [Bacillus swezeyi]MED3071359.1 plantaricin C family lantibiotic [Bacillus swezeyi]MED3081003.1 plantaricin C family lantibiotic [Bacillus swezeyi]